MTVRWQQLIPVDDVSELIVIEEPEIYYIHQGHGFSKAVALTIAGGATGYVMMIPGASATQHVHLRDYVVETTSAPMTVVLYEGATTSANGSSAAPVQMNRTLSTETFVSFYTGPTVTNPGTELSRSLIPGTKQDGGFGRGTAPKEFVFQNEVKYLWAITNNAVGSADIVFRVFWVEAG